MLYDAVLSGIEQAGLTDPPTCVSYLRHAQEVASDLKQELGRLGVRGQIIDLAEVAALLHQVDTLIDPKSLGNPLLLDRNLTTRLDFTRSLLNSLGDREVEFVMNLVEAVDSTILAFPSASLPGVEIRVGRYETDEEAKASACIRAVDAIAHASHLVPQVWGEHGTSDWLPTGELHSRNETLEGNANLLLRRVIVDGGRIWDLSTLQSHLHRIRSTISHPRPSLPEFADVRHLQAYFEAYARLACKDFTVSLRDAAGFQTLEEQLRRTTLVSDRRIFPYKTAKIYPALVQPRSLLPLSRYALEEKIEFLTLLHDVLLVTYCIDTTNFTGFVSVEFGDGRTTPISPPLVEEVLDHGRRGFGLLDGMHRMLMSERLGYTQIRVIVLENVPIPLAYLPVRWDDVTVYVDPHRPRNDEKRILRYRNLSEFPTEALGLQGSVDEANYAHYLFRDLAHLGSSGMRNFR
jgi:hypothetical protein